MVENGGEIWWNMVEMTEWWKMVKYSGIWWKID